MNNKVYAILALASLSLLSACRKKQEPKIETEITTEEVSITTAKNERTSGPQFNEEDFNDLK